MGNNMMEWDCNLVQWAEFELAALSRRVDQIGVSDRKMLSTTVDILVVGIEKEYADKGLVANKMQESDKQIETCKENLKELIKKTIEVLKGCDDLFKTFDSECAVQMHHKLYGIEGGTNGDLVFKSIFAAVEGASSQQKD